MIAVWLLGCAGLSEEPAPPPLDRAVLEVLTSLDEAVERAALDDPHADEAWVRSHALFERAVEPALRTRWPATDVARTEYAFSLVHTALQEGGDAQAAVDALAERLNQQIRGRALP